MDGAEEVARGRMLRERQEAGLLLGERVGHALLAAAGHRPDVGHLGDPAGQLRVEVGDGGEGPGGEERVAKEADHALDAAFLQSCRLLSAVIQ